MFVFSEQRLQSALLFVFRVRRAVILVIENTQYPNQGQEVEEKEMYLLAEGGDDCGPPAVGQIADA